MRLFEWTIASGAAGRAPLSPIGITDAQPRAEARMLEALHAVPDGAVARGWVTVLSYGNDRRTYDRLDTPVEVVRDARGTVRWLAGRSGD